MAEPSVHGCIHSVFRKAIPISLLAAFLRPPANASDHSRKAAHYKHNDIENQASRKRIGTGYWTPGWLSKNRRL